MLAEARYFARMMRGCYDLVRTKPAQDPQNLICEHLRNREANFLHLMQRTVFANPSNPYHRMFEWAGYSYGDLAEAIQADGLENTLSALRDAGVYLAHDEFKGKKPIVRAGRTIQTDPGCFANPLTSSSLETTSSGSRSSGTVTRPSLEFQIYREAQEALVYAQFLSTPRVVGAVYPFLPSTVGIRRSISCHRLGFPIEQWYAVGGSVRDSGHYRLMTRLLVLEARLLGLPICYPEYLSYNDFTPAARWIADQKIKGKDVLFLAPVSMAVRTASAALDAGLDIEGTIFMSGAEPLTDAKRAAIEKAGAEVYPRYGISEMGWVGCSCREMKQGSCVHVMKDSVAVISRRRKAPLNDVEVDSLLITTLHPSSAYVLVNVEMDDCGTIEPAECDCSLKALGFTEQLRDIYSFGKLTGQGITLLGSDMLDVLEKRLPARFGGSPADYQLVEREGDGQTETELRVSPRVGVPSSHEVSVFFLAEVKKLWGGSLTYRQWSQTDGFKVVIEEPIVSGDRKIHALHLLSNRSDGS